MIDYKLSVYNKMRKTYLNGGNILHISHTDLDGYAPQIINKIIQQGVRRFTDKINVFKYMNIEPGQLYEETIKLVESKEYEKYDMIIITDLSYKEKDLLDVENRFPEFIDKLVLIDHHKNISYLNNREWAHVAEKMNTYKLDCASRNNIGKNVDIEQLISATELYSIYVSMIIADSEELMNSNLKMTLIQNTTRAVYRFAKIVSLWDTWRWHSLEDKQLITFIRNWHRLFLAYKDHIQVRDILRDIILLDKDLDVFKYDRWDIKGMVDSLIAREERSYIKFKESLLSTQAVMFDGTIVKIGYCYYKIADLSGACNHVFETSDKYDLIIAIRPDNGLSYRVRPGFGLEADKLALAVNELCGVNAGGHPGAAGVSLNKELIKEAMMYYIESSLEAISTLQRDK